MKITPEHCNYIRKAILAKGNTPTWPTYKAQGLTYRRWLWDILWNAGISPWISTNIYPYANDEHIETVLKSILGKEPV